MRRVMVGGILAGLLFVAVPAWSDQDPVAPAVEPAAAPAVDWSALAREFEATVARYIQLIEFTQRIEAEREQRAFEEALDHYARFEALTERLAAQHEQETEREFEDRVALHVRKQVFTDELLAARKRGETGR
jgi:4-alpha-glucanotransferase